VKANLKLKHSIKRKITSIMRLRAMASFIYQLGGSEDLFEMVSNMPKINNRCSMVSDAMRYAMEHSPKEKECYTHQNKI
jgi:hypothetical protein